jgi:His Kinase A (phospho-acceptor) domain
LEAQVHQAQKLEAIGSLAAGVAHDFNNVLSVVLGYSELLASDVKEGDPLLEDLHQIRAAGLRAAALTRQLLTFSRQRVYMSGYTDDAVVRHGIFYSTVAFIQTPITPQALGRKVRDALDSELRTNLSRSAN